jgi:ketose-bisphosphate aldolase
MIQVARVEWKRFGAQSLEDVAREYFKYENTAHTLLHLDHIPVIDEENEEVDYLPILKRGIDAGYQSVMVDASRLDLQGNIDAVRLAVRMAHDNGIPCEAELGAVMGHESGPQIPYEELFSTKKGFTNTEEAKLFAKETGCDWLSVAVGSVHGAVAENLKFQKKPNARIDVAHVKEIYEATNIPLVLHGGSGIEKAYIQAGIKEGIAKINVGTEIRQAYLRVIEEKNDVAAAQEAVYRKVREIISDMLYVKNTKTLLYGE